MLTNEAFLTNVIESADLWPALAPTPVKAEMSSPPSRGSASPRWVSKDSSARGDQRPAIRSPDPDRQPSPRSTLLYETMEQAPGLYSIGAESHMIIETLPGFHPADREWHSNRLTAEDANAIRPPLCGQFPWRAAGP